MVGAWLMTCWEWQRCTNKYGYGNLKFEKKTVIAHRLAYKLANDFLPNELCVLHRCDNPKCVNPGHLFLGTRKDNNRDREAKGRNRNPLLSPL